MGLRACIVVQKKKEEEEGNFKESATVFACARTGECKCSDRPEFRSGVHTSFYLLLEMLDRN